ncbi:hypothetical protein Tco_1118237 [Tanacetum coccineum]
MDAQKEEAAMPTALNIMPAKKKELMNNIAMKRTSEWFAISLSFRFPFLFMILSISLILKWYTVYYSQDILPGISLSDVTIQISTFKAIHFHLHKQEVLDSSSSSLSSKEVVIVAEELDCA